MSRSLMIFSALLTLGACDAGPAELGQSSASLQAPGSLAELDLPGCEALAKLPGARFQLLRHPDDPSLVVVLHNECPVCVDTLLGAKAHLTRVGGVFTHKLVLNVTPSLGAEAPAEGAEGAEEPEGAEGAPIPSGGDPAASSGTTQIAAQAMVEDDPIPVSSGKHAQLTRVQTASSK